MAFDPQNVTHVHDSLKLKISQMKLYFMPERTSTSKG